MHLNRNIATYDIARKKNCVKTAHTHLDEKKSINRINFPVKFRVKPSPECWSSYVNADPKNEEKCSESHEN